MLLGGLVNIFIALAMTFASTALLVSTVVEGIASMLKWRANNLLESLQYILNVKTKPSAFLCLAPPFKTTLPPIPTSNEVTTYLQTLNKKIGEEPASLDQAKVAIRALNAKLLADLLNHAAINPRGPGNSAQDSVKRSIKPSYIQPRQFAIALMDVLRANPGGTLLPLEQAIEAIPDPQLKQYLTGAYDRAAGDIERLLGDISSWFDSTMDRVGGDYKRYTQLWTVLIGFIAAASFNIDTIKIVHSALSNPILLANIQATVSADALDQLKSMQTSGIAIGWTPGPQSLFSEACANPGLACQKILGWAMTAVAALFGAPFWFDTLKRFVSLRGTGEPPSIAPLSK